MITDLDKVELDDWGMSAESGSISLEFLLHKIPAEFTETLFLKL